MANDGSALLVVSSAFEDLGMLLLGAFGTDVPLTLRERAVATLAASGLSNAEIAVRLVASVRTIDNHLQHAFDKARHPPTRRALQGHAVGLRRRREVRGSEARRADRDTR